MGTVIGCVVPGSHQMVVSFSPGVMTRQYDCGTVPTRTVYRPSMSTEGEGVCCVVWRVCVVWGLEVWSVCGWRVDGVFKTVFHY